MPSLLTLAAWALALGLCWLLVGLSHATSRARRGQARVHLLLTLAAVLGLFAACYPSARCTYATAPDDEHALLTFDGDDCAGFTRLTDATVQAFSSCDAGSPDDARAALAGWTVHVRTESETRARSDGRGREYSAPPNGEGVRWAYGDTDCARQTITLADEEWVNGVAATELVHASQRQCVSYPGLYSDEEWGDRGFACVVDTARRAPLVLTGSEGGP